jgi:hypothetical protein
MGRPVTNKAGEEQDGPKVAGPGLWPALKAAASEWSAHKSAKAGAAIAYYSIFSLGPLIVVVISIAALIFGREGGQREVTEAIGGLLGDKGAESVNTVLSAAGKPSEGIFASIIGTVTLIFAAVGVVVQLKAALERRLGGQAQGWWRDLGVCPQLRTIPGRRTHRCLPAAGVDAADSGPGRVYAPLQHIRFPRHSCRRRASWCPLPLSARSSS